MQKIEADFFGKMKFIYKLRNVGESRACFLLKIANVKKNSYQSELWAVSGEEVFPLLNGKNVADFWPSGAAEVVYTLQHEEPVEKNNFYPETVLYKLSVDKSGEPEEFLTLKHHISELAFCSAESFVFTEQYSVKMRSIAQHEMDPEKAKKLFENESAMQEIDELPFWENGSEFTGDTRTSLYIYIDGKVLQVCEEKYGIENLQYSENTNSVYFLVGHGGSMVLQNRLMRLDLHDVRLIDISLGENFIHDNYVVLQNGSLIVLGESAEKHAMNQNSSFYLAKEGKTPVLLDSTGRYSGENSILSDAKMQLEAVWQSRGDKVYFTSTQGACTEIFTIDSKSGALNALTNSRQDICEFVLDEKGGCIYSSLSDALGVELYHFSAGESRKISCFNRQVFADHDFAMPQKMSFVNTEGVEIDGWVIKPVGLKKGERCPAILEIHGGPKGAFGVVYFHQMQYLASLGFGVFFCNPRGSDGKGRAFADIRGEYGTKDYRDIMEFTESVLQKCKWIDPEKIGVSGGSYGGFMVNWIIGHSNRFKAACTQRSISNWMSMAGTSDIGYFFVPDQLASKDIYGDAQKLWDFSPLKYVENIQTPLLIMHSDNDYRCHLSEGIQMYTALKTKGVETKMIIFKHENHGLSRSGKPYTRILRLEKIASWFKKHLL